MKEEASISILMLPEAKDFAGKKADCLVPIYKII